MKRILIIVTLVLQSLNTFCVAEYAQKLFDAINSNSVAQVRAVLATKEELSADQKNALREKVEQQVLKYELGQLTIFDRKVDEPSLRRGLILSTLGIASLVLGWKESYATNRFKNWARRSQSAQAIADTIKSWATRIYSVSGIGLIGLGVKNFFDSYNSASLNEARAIRQLINKTFSN